MTQSPAAQRGITAGCAEALVDSRSGRGSDVVRPDTHRRYRSVKLGEIVAKRSRFTPLLESTSCGNRPVRRAISAFRGNRLIGLSSRVSALAPLSRSAPNPARGSHFPSEFQFSPGALRPSGQVALFSPFRCLGHQAVGPQPRGRPARGGNSVLGSLISRSGTRTCNPK